MAEECSEQLRAEIFEKEIDNLLCGTCVGGSMMDFYF